MPLIEAPAGTWRSLVRKRQWRQIVSVFWRLVVSAVRIKGLVSGLSGVCVDRCDCFNLSAHKNEAMQVHKTPSGYRFYFQLTSLPVLMMHFKIIWAH